MKTLALAYQPKGKPLPMVAVSGGTVPCVIAFISKKESKNLSQDNQDKRKGGRPKKSSITRKDKTIAVCFSEPELYAIRHRAAKANLPLSVYCHDAILNGEIKEPLKKEELDTLRSLSNMGNNLNQFVKTARFLSAKRLENIAIPLLESIQNIINKLSYDWKNSKRKKL